MLRIRSPACLSSVPVETRRVVKGSLGDRVRYGPKPPLTSSNSKSSSSSSVPIRHSQTRSPHSSEFLQLPRGTVGRKYGVRATSRLQARPWVPRRALRYPGLRLGQLGNVFPRGWGRDAGLTQGTGPLGAGAALAPLAGTLVPGRSCGP